MSESVEVTNPGRSTENVNLIVYNNPIYVDQMNEDFRRHLHYENT